MKKHIQIAMTLLLSTIFALGLSEIFVRVLDIGPEFHVTSFDNYAISKNQVLAYELLPDSADGGKYKISEQGLRDRIYSYTKDKNVFRIAVVGDSITYGFKVDRDESYVEQLERILNQDPTANLKYEVINFGVTGYNITQIAELVRAKVANFDPDLIVYGYCLNDPQEYSIELETLLAKMNEDSRSMWYAKRSVEKELSSSRLYLFAKYTINNMLASARKHSTDWRDDPQFIALREGSYVDYFTRLHTTDSNFKRLEEGGETIRKNAQVPVVVLVFPVLNDLNEYKLGTVHTLLSETFSRHGFGIVDLLKPYSQFTRDGLHNIKADSLHPTAEGHLFAAGVLADYLVNNKLLPSDSKLTESDIHSDTQLRQIGYETVLHR
jgi:hypothetical protein